MHRHGYVGRKFGRKGDERRVMIKNLATSLILDEALTTTTPKAKALVPYAEKLITKAKTGDLAAKRYITAHLLRDDAASKLINDIAPNMKRTSGHLTLTTAGWRRGDHSPMSRVSFVDDISKPVAAAKPSPKAAPKTTKTKPKAAAKKPVVKKSVQKVEAKK